MRIWEERAELLFDASAGPRGCAVKNGFALGLVGDVRTEELLGIAERVSPVPGGVGPMTVAMLIANTFRAHRWSALS